MAAREGDPRLANVTALRQRYERSVGLDLAAQTAECIDYLGNPEVLIGEFVDAFCQIDNATSTDLWVCQPPDPDGELKLEHFYADLEVEVQGDDPFGFVCVEGEIVPLLSEGEVGEPAAGLDYAALVDATGVPALGAEQSESDRTCYQLLLRLLTCLAEVAPENQRKRLNRDYFKNALPREPCFDLHLVVWDLGDGAESTPLHQLTRDLCDVFMRRVVEEVLFPPVLRDIVCLRMDPDAFDGVVDFAWRV